MLTSSLTFQLVAVFCEETDSVPSCIACTPEGTVRYWDSVAHENFFIEISADLQVSRALFQSFNKYLNVGYKSTGPRV
jgi:hypothetical protein